MKRLASLLLLSALTLPGSCRAQSPDAAPAPSGTWSPPPAAHGSAMMRPYRRPGMRGPGQFGQGRMGGGRAARQRFYPDPPLAQPGVPGAASATQTAPPASKNGAEATKARADDGDADKDKDKEKDKNECREKGKARADAPCLSWLDPRVPPRAVILCVHGLGLHSGSWEQFGKRMAAAGYPTYAIDVRGFGSWVQAKGREKVDFDGCLDDVRATLKSVRTANPGLPVVLMGESMGGAVALQATALNPELVDALISSVPAGERFQQKKTELEVALRLLAGFNRPFDIGSKVIEQATDKDELKNEWKDDPLGRLKLAPTELIQFQDFMNDNHDRAAAIKTTPVLIVQGAADKLVKPEGTVELFQELATPDKDLEMVAGGEHLIFEEGQFKEETIKLVAGWLDSHLPPPAPGKATPFIAQARALYARGQIQKAMQALESAVKAQPDSAEAHFLLGAASLRLGQAARARDHLGQAVRAGRGTMIARRANQLLMTMPPALFAPRGPKGGASGLAGGPRTRRRPGTMRETEMPTVLIFSAKWSEPCKDMAGVVEQVKERFGSRVRIVDVDVDDPKNEKLIEQYSVSPVPTVVFLKANGEVADFAIGYSGIDGWVRGMKKILGSPG